MNKELILELKSYIEINKIDSLIVREAVINQDNIMPMKGIMRVDESQTEETIQDYRHKDDMDYLEQFRKSNEETLKDYVNNKKSEETFSTKILQYIDKLGLSDAEIYKKAGIDRRHFSKIRCDKKYQPKKATAITLCIALELDMGETEELLRIAGYSLSNSDTGDLIVKFYIEKKIFDIIKVNEALDYFGLKILGTIG